MPTDREWEEAIEEETESLLSEIKRQHRRLRKYTAEGSVSCVAAKDAYEKMLKNRFALRTIEIIIHRAGGHKVFEAVSDMEARAKRELDSAYERLRRAGCTPI